MSVRFAGTTSVPFHAKQRGMAARSRCEKHIRVARIDVCCMLARERYRTPKR